MADCLEPFQRSAKPMTDDFHSMYNTFVLVTILTSMIPGILFSQLTPKETVEAQRLFANHCGRCHGLKGGGGTGPSLQRSMLVHAPDDESLASIISYGIPGTGMPGSWMLSPAEIQILVIHVRQLGKTVEAPVKGDKSRGKELFVQKGACLTCHIVKGKGGSLGPDLTGIGQRRGPDYLREAIQHPGKNKPLDARGFLTYLVVEAELKTGTRVRGVRINEDSFSIQIRSADNQIHSFRKNDLKTLHIRQEESLMPSFENTFSPEEINNLTAYLSGLIH